MLIALQLRVLPLQQREDNNNSDPKMPNIPRSAKFLSLSALVLTGAGYHQYHNNHSFKAVCNLVYAGSRMALIYKYGQEALQEKHTKACAYLRDALKSNGGIYLKLGQLIATLDVIVPDQYRFVMSTLTRECAVSSFEEVRKTIEEDLGYPLDVVFRQFDEKPISSASIAQVHRGRLLNGEEVAVKIQHPQLASEVQNDIQMMWAFVGVAKWLFKEFNYQWLVEGFEKNIKIELDFRTEAANMRRTQHFLKQNNFKNVYIPQLYLNPTNRVLVMEFIHAVHLDELDKLRAMNINTKALGTTFAKMIVKMIHKEGFVHADTHSGNLMARKYKGKDQLIVLDHGIYQELDKSLLRSYNQFWLGLILNDEKLFQKAGRELGTTSPRVLRCMLTSKTDQELSLSNRSSLFDLNPTNDRNKIMAEAAKNHEKIVKVLQELKREFLLLLKVNEFARSIENMLAGREMGVYRDVAQECVNNMGFPWYRRWYYFFKMWWTN